MTFTSIRQIVMKTASDNLCTVYIVSSHNSVDFLRDIVFCCNFKFYCFKETCCMFWPNEMNKSMEFDHIKVNHDSTISKTGYEVTRLDALAKGIVSLRY